jgi:hypothetical protein
MGRDWIGEQDWIGERDNFPSHIDLRKERDLNNLPQSFLLDYVNFVIGRYLVLIREWGAHTLLDVVIFQS